jgi:hypothetical protein
VAAVSLAVTNKGSPHPTLSLREKGACDSKVMRDSFAI